MKKILKWLDDNAELYLCVFLMSFMTLVTFIQVVMRKVFNNSLSWSEELARYLFIWTIYIGISYGVKMDKHVAVDAVYSYMPKGVKKYYAMIAYALFLLFAVAIVYYGVTVVGMQISSGQVSPAMGLPMQYVYVAPVVGMVLTVIRLVQKIIEAAKAEEWE